MSSRPCVTGFGITERASSNVRERFELSIRCFSGSPSTSASRPASVISSPNLSFNFFSSRDTQDSHRSILAFSSRREHPPRQMIVRRSFRFLPRVVGSYRFCSLRHASNEFFRELATMSFVSRLVSAMSAACICCSTKSRFVHSTIHVGHSEQEFNVNGFPRDFRCLFSSSRQHHLRHLDLSNKNSIRFLRPLLKIFQCLFELGLSLDGTHCVHKSDLISNQSLQREHLLL